MSYLLLRRAERQLMQKRSERSGVTCLRNPYVQRASLSHDRQYEDGSGALSFDADQIFRASGRHAFFKSEGRLRRCIDAKKQIRHVGGVPALEKWRRLPGKFSCPAPDFW